MSMKELIQERLKSGDFLDQKHVHPRLMKMLQMGGMNTPFVRAEGHYLFDTQGKRYLDLLSGGGVYFFGRNHPKVNAAIRDVVEMDVPNLCVVNASILGGLLAERILKLAGKGFSKVQYANSGAEANEVAIRFSRFVTRRRRYLHLEGAFHGRSYGAISLCGFNQMKEGMEPRMPICTSIRPNDLAALRRELSKGDVAALFMEACQGMTLDVLDHDYLREARKLCDEFGTLLVLDEVQTGFGRLGEKWFAFQAAGILPDMVTLSKVLSGGQMPVAAVLVGEHVYDQVFKSFQSGPIYFSTFGENNLAMAAGLATLDVLEEMDAPAAAARVSQKIRAGLNDLATRYDVIDRVAGKGMMIGTYFKNTDSSALLKAQQALMGAFDKASFGAAMNVRLFTEHQVIVQVPGPGLNAIKILPPITLTDEDIQYFLDSYEGAIQSMYGASTGPALALGKTAVTDAVKSAAKKVKAVAGVEKGAGPVPEPKKAAAAGGSAGKKS
ncbi:MAG: aspartate aminotransferase family protein [Deltaproteobacteria bacterium]|nr:aspartate aminotransferase family protein [Deltaproteobacteria bacterium]